MEEHETSKERTILWTIIFLMIGAVIMLSMFTVFAPKPITIQKVIDISDYKPGMSAYGYVESVIDIEGNALEFITMNHIYEAGDVVRFRAVLEFPRTYLSAISGTDFIFPIMVIVMGTWFLIIKYRKRRRGKL